MSWLIYWGPARGLGLRVRQDTEQWRTRYEENVTCLERQRALMEEEKVAGQSLTLLAMTVTQTK